MDTTNTRAAGRTFNLGDRVALSSAPDHPGTVTLVYPEVAGKRGYRGYTVHWDADDEPEEDTVYTDRSLVEAVVR